jgi:hypothetical protein
VYNDESLIESRVMNAGKDKMGTVVKVGNYKRGIVMNVVEGKFQFLHRTSEYFTARWLSGNFRVKQKRSLTYSFRS